MARWQNPRMSLDLYSESAAISMRRMVVICWYISRSWALVTSTSRSGFSHWYERKESSCSLTVNGLEGSEGASRSWVVSAVVWMARTPKGCFFFGCCWVRGCNLVMEICAGTYDSAGNTDASEGGHYGGGGKVN